MIKTLSCFIENLNIIFWSYTNPRRKSILKLVNKVKKESGLLLKAGEGYQIFSTVQSVAKIKGDIAEVGTYRGGSAKIICEAKGDKELHIFDTFEGIPGVSDKDAGQFHQGQFPSSKEMVEKYLQPYRNVFLYKGIFPETALPIKDKRFSFVHLDVDTYESTKSCLEFFFPRMNPGGIILSHDYVDTKGVPQAFNEFFSNRLESVLELSGNQCLVVKI